MRCPFRRRLSAPERATPFRTVRAGKSRGTTRRSPHRRMGRKLAKWSFSLSCSVKIDAHRSLPAGALSGGCIPQSAGGDGQFKPFWDTMAASSDTPLSASERADLEAKLRARRDELRAEIAAQLKN